MTRSWIGMNTECIAARRVAPLLRCGRGARDARPRAIIVALYRMMLNFI